MIDNKNTQGTAQNEKIFVSCPSCKASLKIAPYPPTFSCPVCGNIFSTQKKERSVRKKKDVNELVSELAVSTAQTEPEQSTPKKKFLDRIRFDKWKAWIYLLPAILLLAIFTVWPIINTVRVAFLDDYNSLGSVGGDSFNFGIENFITVLSTGDQFITALKNTMLLTLITVPLSTFLALIIAVCLNAIKPLQKLYQTIFFLPYVTNSIAIGMVFAALFDVVGDFNFPHLVNSWGFINNLLGKFGVEPINWIDGVGDSSYWTKMTVLIIYIVWNALPFKILILLGGLQSVNKQYYDAAKIDSTPRWRVFTKITVPLLSPMIAYVVITGFIGGFKEYTSIIGIFGDDMAGGQLFTMVGFIYDALPDAKYGEASAAALILFVIIFIVTMINLGVSKKKTHY